jgi:hypothetical protein
MFFISNRPDAAYFLIHIFMWMVVGNGWFCFWNKRIFFSFFLLLLIIFRVFKKLYFVLCAGMRNYQIYQYPQSEVQTSTLSVAVILSKSTSTYSSYSTYSTYSPYSPYSTYSPYSPYSTYSPRPVNPPINYILKHKHLKSHKVW